MKLWSLDHFIQLLGDTEIKECLIQFSLTLSWRFLLAIFVNTYSNLLLFLQTTEEILGLHDGPPLFAGITGWAHATSGSLGTVVARGFRASVAC